MPSPAARRLNTRPVTFLGSLGVSIRSLGLFLGTSVLSGLLAPMIATSAAAADDAARDTAEVEQMALPQLQLEAARLQAQFVRASLELEQAQLDLDTARAAEVDALARAERAQALADAESGELAAYLGLLYTEGPSMDPDLLLLLTGFGQTDSMLRENLVFEEVTKDQATVVERAQQAQGVADRLHTEAQQRKDDADAAEATVQEILAKISARADEVTAAAESSFTDNTQAALFNDAEQTARNTSAKTVWRGYLRSLEEPPEKVTGEGTARHGPADRAPETGRFRGQPGPRRTRHPLRRRQRRPRDLRLRRAGAGGVPEARPRSDPQPPSTRRRERSHPRPSRSATSSSSPRRAPASTTSGSTSAGT